MGMQRTDMHELRISQKYDWEAVSIERLSFQVQGFPLHSQDSHEHNFCDQKYFIPHGQNDSARSNGT